MSVSRVESTGPIQHFNYCQGVKGLADLIVALVLKILSGLSQQTGKVLGDVEMISNGNEELDSTPPVNCPQQLLREIIDILGKEKVDLHQFYEKKEQLPASIQAEFVKNIPSTDLPPKERIKAIRQFFVNLLEANS
ncbi:MAG: hypothetical protein JSS30_01565 [Verrucomicrobia bacterium]|nr:hypothetical protein [Verrucomicrobiota bacterium]